MSTVRRIPNARRMAGVASGLLALSTAFAAHSAFAADRVQIQFWNAMSGKLGETVQHLANEFNKSQDRYEVVPVFKGSYKQTMLSAIAAFRANNPPDIVQIFDVGTATMMAAKGAYVPVHSLMANEKIAFSTKQFIPAAASYYSDAKGRLVSMPFNSSTPVIFYNKDMFAKAGVQPPKTWADMAVVGKKLRADGAACGFTTGWPAWVQMEQFSLWNGLHYATHDNGYKAVKGVKLRINDKPYVEHLAQLGEWSKSGVFEYGGIESKSRPMFVSGHCAMYMGSSASYAAIKAGAKFPFGIAPMPYDGKLSGAPQNTVVGGASLWVMKGRARGSLRRHRRLHALHDVGQGSGLLGQEHRLRARHPGRFPAAQERRLLQRAAGCHGRHRRTVQQAAQGLDHGHPPRLHAAAAPDRAQRDGSRVRRQQERQERARRGQAPGRQAACAVRRQRRPVRPTPTGWAPPASAPFQLQAQHACRPVSGPIPKCRADRVVF